MVNDLVKYSRAGDAFHYRWAARRCLQLIHPHATIKKIVIEGSQDETSDGELVIDVSEYSQVNGEQHIDYYQLKHSTVQVDNPFTISNLEDTVTGFAKRFIEWKSKDAPVIAFTIITNRKIADSFRDGVNDIAANKISQANFKSTLERYSGLTGSDLIDFCKIFHFQDSEGNYNVQQEELRVELSRLIVDSVDPSQIDTLVAMVQERVLPDTQNAIVREDVLKRFGITSERQLYPAPAELEPAGNVIELPQYLSLKNGIETAIGSVIIHAEGGVGKSVFCRHLIRTLNEGSVGIVYDCFGAGKYRNRSESRHSHRQVVTQIVNELASKGLCNPLLLSNTSRDEDIVRTFLERVEVVVSALQKVNSSAKLLILFDAADNAEMAAKDFNEKGFAHELIREQMPQGCQLVFLCRTERINLLNPSASVLTLQLNPFSEHETLLNLRSAFSDASENDGHEFHRLTNANPRVQANAISANHKTVHDLLISLGPGGVSIEKLIESQLLAAVDKVKHHFPVEFQQPIDAICLSLAILPPHIPISVLSSASCVDESTIKSFVSDIGRSLWILDMSVQFRDEPTETWFRNSFAGKTSDYENCVQLLEPLAKQSTYVAEVLPHLYLRAGQYQKLIQVSLTDDFLPTDNPIDARTIRVFRLQFAFKAALKTKQIPDAIKVAIKAGEEVAGNRRQLLLLRDNIELLVKLQSKEQIQEIAFKQQLLGAWDGSENIYTASLLSGIKEYQGEARSFLRSGMNWLGIAFEEEAKLSKDQLHHQQKISEGDILETAYAILNLEGSEACIGFLTRMNPPYVFGIMNLLTNRLMDEARFAEINDLAFRSKGRVHLTVAIASNLLQLGKIIDKEIVVIALDLLCHSKTRIKKPEFYYHDRTIPRAIVAFADCCFALKLSPKKILRVLRHYVPVRADRTVGNERLSDERPIFLKALALRMLLLDQSDANIDEIVPKDLLKENQNHNGQKDLSEFKEIVFSLLPWYLLRGRILRGEKLSLIDATIEAQRHSNKERGQRYRSHDPLPGEIGVVNSSIATLLKEFQPETIQSFFDTFLKPKDSLSLRGKLVLLNAAGRLSHLSLFRSELERDTYKIVKSIKDDGPDIISSRFLALARAVLSVDQRDARVYFDHAIDITSKFGDEVVQRWEALVELGVKASEKTFVPDSLAYRFIRCAEVVGNAVSREKYWDREDAIRVCTKMSPGVGLAAISRWRDRNIGTFQYELKAAIDQLLVTDKIDPSLAWSTACFFSSQRNLEFLEQCLSKTDSQTTRQSFIIDDIRLNGIDGVERSYWSGIVDVSKKWIADKDWIKDTFSFLDGIPEVSKIDSDSQFEVPRTDPSINWDDVFKGLDFLSIDGFSSLVIRHRQIIGDKTPGNHMRFLLNECLNRLSSQTLLKFLNVLFASDYVDRYDAQGVLENIPISWTQKVSFPSIWEALIRKFSESYAYELSDSYGFDSLVRSIKADEHLQSVIIEGINVGLIDAKDLDNGETFFAYAKLSARCVTEAEARQLLDYGLQRFEQHIENDTGDGEWSSWLEVSQDIKYNLAGIIWSALGSPRAAERWNAAHSVRTLIEQDCTSAVDALINWCEHNSVDAFGSRAFPFYNLHARQYLLIALARASMDHSDRLKNHITFLGKLALESDHILIQKFAIDTCLNIEKAASGSFTKSELNSFSNITKSRFPAREEKKYNFQTESYWHANKLVDENINYHFGWDFDRYWYQPLGDVFGIPEKHVQDLAASVLTKEWISDYDGKHSSDPRSLIWNQYSSDRETWHDHGSYPRVDNLDFYLSYHAMLVVAGRLLQTMPVMSSSYDEGDSWVGWLSGHLLTRTDGKWLSDFRDPVPIVRPSWVFDGSKAFDEWKLSINDSDFINCLISGEYLIAKGGWHEKKSERLESYYITSAFVSKNSSDALLRALSTASDQHDYKVPGYEEKNMEFDSGIFKLSGWIVDPHNEKELDGFDPKANNVEYPSHRFGESIRDLLNLYADTDGKKWFTQQGECVGTCASWVSAHSGRDRDEEADQSGMRLTCSLKTVEKICQDLDRELIIEVSISRKLSYSSRSHREGNNENEQHRIFILNSHGELRTIGKNLSLR